MQKVMIKGVGHLRVNFKKSGKSRKNLRRFVVTKGVLAGSELAAEVGLDVETINHLVKEVMRIARAGYEVRIGTKEDCIRLYPMLDSHFKTMYLTSQTCGEVRECVRKLTFDLYHDNEKFEREDVVELNDKVQDQYNKTQYIAVTPDLVIACPQCGFDRIRVGKALAQKEKNEE